MLSPRNTDSKRFQINTATINPSVLATSNGENGSVHDRLGSTSKGSAGSAATVSVVAPTVAVLVALLAGVGVLFEVIRRT